MKIVITITDDEYEVDYVEPPKLHPQIFSDELVALLKQLQKFMDVGVAGTKIGPSNDI